MSLADRSLLACVMAAICLGSHGSAQASPFNLAAPIPFSGSGLDGVVLPAQLTDGPLTCLGSNIPPHFSSICDPAHQDFVLFTVRLDAASLDVGNIRLVVSPFAALGVGRLETGEQAPSGSNSGSDASFGFMELCGGICPDQLQGGETSTPLYAGYALGGLAGTSPSLLIRAVPNDGAFTVAVPLTLTVPEPAGLNLIGAALAALAVARRNSPIERRRVGQHSISRPRRLTGGCSGRPTRPATDLVEFWRPTLEGAVTSAAIGRSSPPGPLDGTKEIETMVDPEPTLR